MHIFSVCRSRNAVFAMCFVSSIRAEDASFQVLEHESMRELRAPPTPASSASVSKCKYKGAEREREREREVY